MVVVIHSDDLATVPADNAGPRHEPRSSKELVPGFIGRSGPIRALFDRIGRIAVIEQHASICGETGTGKELIARAVHLLSPRQHGPFVEVNCAAIPASLFEAEFFGHERGAFTGAHDGRSGFFECAHGGTLFLDEVGELPLECQAKLLRAVEQARFMRVGARTSTSVDVRIVSATNADLSRAAKLGQFRPDLYYRLTTLMITVPAVRDRGADVEVLVDHFLDLARREVGRPDLALSALAERVLLDYSWPGNVREIAHALRHAALESQGVTIEVADLPHDIVQEQDRMVEHAVPPPSASEPLAAAIARFEADHIRQALLDCRGHRVRAARLLGITERTLYSKIRKYLI